MLTIYSADHMLHRGTSELKDGELRASYECPERAAAILAAVERASLGPIVEPESYGRDRLQRIHADAYVHFLEHAWDAWLAEGRACDALPFVWPARGMRQVEPDHIDGKLAYFAFDAGTPITAGTWRAATTAANIALTGATRIAAGVRSAFALCRPPGHHASADLYGGYCFLNNAALAAQELLDSGATRVAILDIDYHHGNGTQSIFYPRNDVLVVSIHAHPDDEFPYFLGFVDECGAGDGEGFNANYPLPRGTGFNEWSQALDAGCKQIWHFGPDAVVVSVGVDTYIDDPISGFRLASDDYLQAGARIAEIGVPTLLIMEGGYDIDSIGVNVVNILGAFPD